MLHFAYYNCLTTIHRMSVHHGFWTSRLSNYAISGLSARPLNPRVFASASLCVAAARSSIQLIKYINFNDCPCVWLIMYYPVSALVTLFANTLQNPMDPLARTDLHLMHDVYDFLSAIREEDENGSVARMLAICKEFNRIGKMVLDKAEKETQTRRKRKQGDKDEEIRPKTPLPVGATIFADANFFNSANAESASRGASNASTPGCVSDVTVGTEDNLIPQQHQQQQLEDMPMSEVDQESIFDTFSPPPNFSWPGDFPSPAPPQTPKFTFTTAGSGGTPIPDRGGDMFTNGAGYGSLGSPLPSMPSFSGGPGSFQAPYILNELWPMPGTLEWDWADFNMGGATWPMGGGDGT